MEALMEYRRWSKKIYKWGKEVNSIEDAINGALDIIASYIWRS